MEQFLNIPITMVGYKPVVTVQINGMEAHLVLDTGAFFGLLYPEAAKRAGLRVGTSPVLLSGVGGTVRPGLATIKNFVIGNQTVHHVDMLVYGDRLAGGDMDGILGQNLMRAGDIEIDLADVAGARPDADYRLQRLRRQPSGLLRIEGVGSRSGLRIHSIRAKPPSRTSSPADVQRERP